MLFITSIICITFIISINNIIRKYFSYKKEENMKTIHNFFKIIILLLIIILGFDINKYAYEENIKIIGHRGASALEPENTIPSFNRAARLGAWGVEADIYVLKDGNIVVFHDSDVERMTNGIGKIKDMNLIEVKALNIDSGNNISNYNNLKIPTLDEYLNCCAENKLVPIIEFKEVTIDKVKEIIYKIKKYELEDETIIISTSHEWIKYIREYSDKIHFQYLNDITLENINLLKKYGNYGIDVKADKITKEKVDLAHLNGAKVNVWTVNSEKEINRLTNMGVDMITSDLGF